MEKRSIEVCIVSAQVPTRPPRNFNYPRPPPIRPPMASQPMPPSMGSWPQENYIGLPGSRPAGNSYASAGQHQGLGFGEGVLSGAAAGGLMLGLDRTALQNGLTDSIMSQFHGGSLSISSDPFFSSLFSAALVGSRRHLTFLNLRQLVKNVRVFRTTILKKGSQPSQEFSLQNKFADNADCWNQNS